MSEEIPEMVEDYVRDIPSSDDKLWSALGYPIPLIAIIALLMEDKKDRGFIRYHAIQSLAFNVVLWVILPILMCLSLGIFSVLWLVTLWPAYDSYQGRYTEIPVITNFIKKQGWIK